MEKNARKQGKQQKTLEALYNRYGRPLESMQSGKYVAISPEGKVLVGDTLHETLKKAILTAGPGSFIFKLGEMVVGRWTKITACNNAQPAC